MLDGHFHQKINRSRITVLASVGRPERTRSQRRRNCIGPLLRARAYTYGKIGIVTELISRERSPPALSRSANGDIRLSSAPVLKARMHPRGARCVPAKACPKIRAVMSFRI